MPIPIHLLKDADYCNAAENLQKQGYTATRQQSGIFPMLFHREKETLFLFRAALEGRNSYQVVWVDSPDLQPADFSGAERPVLSVPRSLYQEPERDITRYVWLPRLKSQAPPLLASGMMTKQDVSELMGLALSTIQSALASKSNPLPPSATLNSAPLFSVADVLEWNIKRMRAQRARKGNTYEKAYRSLCKTALLKRVERDLSLGRVTEDRLYKGISSLHAKRVEKLDDLLSYLGTLKRSSVLDFLIEVGILSQKEEQS